MPRKLEDFLADPTSAEKELSRKLYWSITSTIALSKEEKSQTFSWCVSLAVRVLKRAASEPRPHLPPSVKLPATSPNGRVDNYRRNGQAVLAGGGVAGSFKEGRSPSLERPPRTASPSPPSPAFLETQARKKAAALKYLAGMKLSLTKD